MSAQPICGPDHPLVAAIEQAHQESHAALAEGRHLDAVVWLSAHLAAGQRTLHRAARKSGGRSKAERAALVAADHRLELILRRTEQHYSGDSLAAQLDRARLQRDLRNALEEHSRAEHELLCTLVDELDPAATDRIESAYREALEHAPTRPHPHVPHEGFLGAVAFRVDAWRDHVMDTMDGRHVPAPRPAPRAVTPGKWGSYLLGQVVPRTPEDGR